MELQPFTVDRFSTDPPTLLLQAPERRSIQGTPMRLSGLGAASGTMVDVGRAFAGDVPADGLEGKIALIERGIITFEQKISRVAEAGALAAVVYNNEPGGFGGQLGIQANIPAISISRESGADIKELMTGGEVTATVSVVIEASDSRNVIAELPGSSDDGRVVVLGGHYDTVPDTQGANDNGSGIAALITIARHISQMQFPFTVRFIAFGSEEIGLFGSRHYVGSLTEEERGSIIAMLNFDVPGSGEVVEAIGSADLVTQVTDYADEHDLAVEQGTSLELEGATSDHAPFSDAGIPTVFFPADDISRINSPADTLEFVEQELMGIAAVLGLALLDSLAEH